MKPEHRSALLAMAARRGQKGFSAVLEEAIGVYLGGENERQQRLRGFQALKGSVTPNEADEMRKSTIDLRESWR